MAEYNCETYFIDDKVVNLRILKDLDCRIDEGFIVKNWAIEILNILDNKSVTITIVDYNNILFEIMNTRNKWATKELVKESYKGINEMASLQGYSVNILATKSKYTMYIKFRAWDAISGGIKDGYRYGH